MPMYCYEDKFGQVFDLFFEAGKAPQTIRDPSHGLLRRNYSAESVGVPAKTGWPLVCCASGVHPDQAPELRQLFKDVGVPTEVTNQGDVVYTDAAHRKKALKARGFVDKSAYN